MASMRFTVVYASGETVPVTVGPKQQVQFEREHKTSLQKAISDVHMEHIYWLAWAGLRAKAQAGLGPSVKLFDDWLDDIADVEFDEDAAGVDPTVPGPPTG